MAEDNEFFEIEAGKKAWLITWNKDKWYWEGYAENCEATKLGKVYVDSWSCTNTNPKIGDEVFLIKLGEKPRGIIGHGYVSREIYERNHYDSVKAAEGKKEKAIDVEFDRLINYKKEKYIDQAELVAKCGAQHWSPQNSGIEIKQEVLPTLHLLWEAVIESSDEWWPSLSEYDPGITAEEYYSLFLNKSVTKNEWLEALYDLYQMPEYLGTCADLASRFHKPYARYNRYLTSLARKIRETTGCPAPNEQDSSSYWPVLFQGKSVQNDNSHKGVYCWKMREPVVKSMEMLVNEGVFKEVNINDTVFKFDHNLILYGPPGTGKTYYSVIYAVAICDGKSINEVSAKPYSETLERYKELKEEGRIAFTTFHQSYGYEEFIEGIKPNLDSDSDSIGYTIEDGVFKEFCKRAKAIKVRMPGKRLMKTHPRIWGMILGGTGHTELKRECFKNNEVRLGWSEVSDEDVEGDFYGDTNASWQAKHMVSDFKNTMEIGDILVIEKSNTSIDAIGVVTGEYTYDQSRAMYPRSRKVEWLVKDIDQDMIPFLPNGRKQLSRFSLFAFDYIGLDVITQILDENTIAPIVEVEQEKKPYVFIIDEINRGSISKIFGELITLIEDTKRAGSTEAMEAILPYSGESFSVPDNV